MNARASEVAKYERAYQHPDYRLGERRQVHIESHLKRIPKGSLLDVSTGRGEVLLRAKTFGHGPVVGTEAVSYLCNPERGIVYALAHDLPFECAAFDTVTMFDVMEHLLPSDTAPVCKELARVAKKRVLLTVHNGPHRYRGEDLHINRRASYHDWHTELEQLFSRPVIRHGAEGSISEMFEVVI